MYEIVMPREAWVYLKLLDVKRRQASCFRFFSLLFFFLEIENVLLGLLTDGCILQQPACC